MKRLLYSAILVGLLGAGYLLRGYFFEAATQPSPKRPAAPAQQVVADTATEGAAPVLVSAIGTVQSIATVMVKSRMDGEIVNVNFAEGQEVKEGDILFTLDDRAAQAQLQQAQANLERDRAQLKRNQLEIKRQTELAGRGVASEQKLEDTQTSVDVYEAAVRADEAAVQTARVNLNYAIIRAPIAGQTGSVLLKRGNIVKAVDTAPAVAPLVTITQLRPIYVAFTAPEEYVADIRKAMATGPLTVTVTLPNQPKNPVSGALSFVDNQVDVTTGTISLKATFANDDTQLWPGEFVNVTLTLGVQEKAVMVPSVAVQIGPNGPYVFVIKPDSTVELRLVQVDRAVEDKSVIAKGLAAGERVVVDGQLRLSNGARVAAQGTAPPKAQPTPVAERTP